MYCAAHIWCWPTSVVMYLSIFEVIFSSLSIAYWGLINSPACLYAKHFTFFHSLILLHHFFMLVFWVSLPPFSQVLMISFKAISISETIGTSTCIFLFIEEGSISICILYEFGLKASVRPVILSSKRAPIQIKTSQSCMAMFASYVPCIPSMPNQFSPEAG